MAGIGHDLLVGWLGDEALLGLVEVTLVLERQGSGDTLAQLDGEFRRQGALGVEVLAFFSTRVGRAAAIACGDNRGSSSRNDEGEREGCPGSDS